MEFDVLVSKTQIDNSIGNSGFVSTKKYFFFTCSFSDGLVGMAIVGGIGLGVAGLAGLIGLAVAKGAKS